uniref:Uncharacterized protein n=1 Tax=Cacopsylla melanoneura TaxID=428564 RepID=A0A8D9BWF1_9HEMI
MMYYLTQIHIQWTAGNTQYIHSTSRGYTLDVPIIFNRDNSSRCVLPNIVYLGYSILQNKISLSSPLLATKSLAPYILPYTPALYYLLPYTHYTELESSLIVWQTF